MSWGHYRTPSTIYQSVRLPDGYCDKIKRTLKMRFSRCKHSGPRFFYLARCLFNKTIFQKFCRCHNRRIFTPDPKKTLSPVRSTSAFASIAARKIGRSFTSLIYVSDTFSSVGNRTNAKVSKATESLQIKPVKHC